MILDSCPNLSDPEVAREFNEIKDATSEKTAYNIWSLNNGYGIDKAPNGAKSILFESLLRECNGNKTAAIRAKAALYGNRFREWFGDWLQEDKTNVSKVVDENGEPLIVYHSGPEGIDVFRDEVYEDGVATGIPNAIYTSDDRYVSGSYIIQIGDLTDDGTNEDPYYLEKNAKKPAVKTYALFSNIKNPVVIDAKGKEWNKIEHNGKVVSTRDIEYETRLSDNDGVIIKNVIDAVDFYGDGPQSTVYIQYRPNQIKSATGNIEIEKPGTGFSTTDNNIYHLETDYINTPDITNSDLFGFKLGEDRTIEEFANTFDLSNDFTWFTKLLDLTKQFGVKIRFENPQRAGIAGEFLGDTITLYIDLNNPAFVHTVIHEMLHSVLHSLLDAEIESLDENLRLVRDAVEKLYKLFCLNKNKPSKFGNIINIHEFVSEFSNKEFRQYLKHDKALRDLFKNVIDYLMAMLGIKNRNNDPCDFVIEQLLDAAKLDIKIEDASLNLTNEQYANIYNQINSSYHSAQHTYNVFEFDGITVLWKKDKDGGQLEEVATSGTERALKLYDFAHSYYLLQPNSNMLSYEDAELDAISHMPVVQVTLDSQRENWIRSQNPQTDEERANLAREFDLKQLRDNTNNVVNKIVSEYNLEHNGTEYISRDDHGKYIAMLVNSIQKRLGDPNFAPIEVAFLNCTLLGNNDISTLILQMAKVYIEDFYQADAILEVMKIIDPKGNMHKDDLVAELTNLVVKAVVDPSSVESGTLTKINNKIVNFVRKRFGRDAISEEAKLVLIDAIAKNMSCCNDLERTNTEDLLHDVKWYEITGKESQVTPKDIVNQIKRGIKIQIKALKSVTNVDEAKVLILNQLLAQFEDIDLENNPDDVLGVVSDFIAHGMVEINSANADLRNMLNGDPADIDDARLYQIKTDVIGYYRAIVNNYIIPFTRNTSNPSLQPGGALYATVKDMLNRCTNTQHLYDYVLQQHTEALIDRFVDSNVNIGDKERFKVNCKLWLHNKVNNGDLGFFENWIKSAVSSHSPIVRIIDMFVREFDTEVRLQSMARARKLQNMYKQCEPTLSRFLPFNYQRMFCEIDSDGQTTGNFLAAVNVGQFEKEKKAFIDKWIEERGVVMGEDGVLEFPDDQTWKDFNDAYDDFLEGKQHRRYTAEYYKLERQYMSRDTIEYRRNIRHRIQLLYDKCFDKEVGAPNIWKLDRDDMQRLQDLLKFQLNLSNPYIIEYDSNGKISSITEKTGDLLRMAEEIGAFNKAIAGKIKFSPNYNKYNAAKEAMKNKFGEDSMEYKWFVWNFSSAQVKSEYYDKLRLIFGPKSEYVIKRADIIYLKIRAIINATLPKSGKYILDLSKMSDEAYAELKSLEEAKYHLFENVEKTDGKKLTEEEKAELAKMHHYEYVKNPETNKEYIKELEELYRQLGRYQEFLNKYFVTTSERVRPLSIFSYDAISQEYIDYETPIGMFSDVDVNSEFVDPEYDPEDNEFMNVDKKRYHNDKYDEMIKDPRAKKFYDEMLAMMEEAWSMLPDINRHYKYMLPLRRGNISQLFARDLINTFTGRKGRQKSSFGLVVKNVIKLTAIGAIGGFAFGSILTLLPATWMAASTAILSATSYGTIAGFVAGLLTRDKNIADRLLSVTENDIEFNETYAVRPDGSEVETIPIRFVRRLDDPTAVSTSLIHSVSSFYEMALNYKLKEKLAPIVENILFELSGGFSGQSITDQADRIRTHKSAMIYGRRKTGIARRSSNKMTESEQKITKLVQFLLNTTHAKMLPWNGTSMYKNAIDSILSFMVNVVSGKFITLQDIGDGIVDMGKDIVNGAFSNIGKADTKSFTGAAMQYNGLHMSVSETFDDTEKYWLRRVTERFYSMGPFTLIDYTFKGLFLHSVYNTYRLVLNPSTGKREFMNKQEAQFAYANTLGRKEGLKRWKESDTRLKNAYEVTEEGLKLKPEFENIVRPIVNGKPSYKLETRVSGLAKEQTAVINGMLDSQDINKISQNFIGASILLMRGWMVSQLIDYNKDGQDFAVFASNTEEVSKLVSNTTLGSLQSKIIGSLDAFVIQSAPTELEGQYNFATGFIERGWWVGWIKACRNIIKHKHLTRHNKYQLKALATILITTVSLGLLTHPLYNWREQADSMYKDTNPYNIEKVASNFLYTGTVAAYSERFGQVGPLGFMNSFLELVNSPTVASSYVKDLNSTLDACEDLITLLDAMYNGEDVNQTEPMQIVKRGNFKGRKKITRDLLKASTELPGVNTLGITNIYKTISPDAQKEKLKFYKKTIPFAGAQPWVKLPESGSSSNKQVKPKKAEEDLSWIK